MTERDEPQGLKAVWALGLDMVCDCGHEDGYHALGGKCEVLECECAQFRRAYGEKVSGDD